MAPSTLRRRMASRIDVRLLQFVSFVCAIYSLTLSSTTFGTIKFDLKPFASGGFKDAYWGTVQDGSYLGYSEGTKLVLKSMTPTRRKKGYKITDWDIKAQEKASELAKLFNAEVKPQKMGEPCNVYMRVGKMDYMSDEKKLPNGTIVFHEKEAYIVELPIYGNFEKFNSNTGWSSGKGTLADTFSHWTWARTDGEILVCDLQGHRGDPSGPPHGGKKGYYYCLTDPAISSKKQTFGTTDLGQKGIETWFKWHKCNSFCQRIGLDKKRPREYAHGNKQKGTAHNK